MADLIDLPPAVLPEVVERLTEKRMAVEKEVSMIGEAPSSLKDVFELCRGFEKAFSTALNSKNLTQQDTPTAAKIKEAFMSERGLAGQICKLQLDDLFKLDAVKKMCKQADGYQPHLVSPEGGLRQLASEALTRVNGPVSDCIQKVYGLLLEAARDASNQAGAYVDGVSPGIKDPVQVPAFKTMILPAVQKALEEWRKEAETMAFMLVDMERSYISSGFFRTTMSKRVTKAQQAARMASAPPKPTASTKISGVASTIRSRFSRLNKQDNDDDEDDSTYTAPAARTSASGGKSEPQSEVKELTAAYFEKSQSEGSFLGRGWQKRFFIFKNSQKTLYYFKSAEDVQKPDGLKGSVVISECVVEDIDEKGNLRTRISPESVYLRIRHRDPSKAAVKDNNSLVLKADSLATKTEWLALLQRATGVSSSRSAAAESAESTTKADKPRHASDNEDERDDEATSEPEEPPEEEDPAASWQPYSFDNGTFDARMGEGAPIFRAENFRDTDGHLLPAPVIVINPKDGVADPRRSIETQETRYDMVLRQFGEDMSIYIRMVCDTIVNTVPKAVIHGLVKKAEHNVLNKLFAHVHGLGEAEMARLLEEDDGTKKRRESAKRTLEEMTKALDFVHHLQGEVHMAANKEGAPKKERVTIQAMYVAYSGLINYLPRDKQAQYRRLLDDPHAPRVLKEEVIPRSNYTPGTTGAAEPGLARQSSASLRRPSVAPSGKSEPLRRPPPPPPGMR